MYIPCIYMVRNRPCPASAGRLWWQTDLRADVRKHRAGGGRTWRDVFLSGALKGRLEM